MCKTKDKINAAWLNCNMIFSQENYKDMDRRVAEYEKFRLCYGFLQPPS